MKSVTASQPSTGMEQADFADILRDSVNAWNSTLNLDEVLDLILTQVGLVVSHGTADIRLVEDETA